MDLPDLSALSLHTAAPEYNSRTRTLKTAQEAYSDRRPGRDFLRDMGVLVRTELVTLSRKDDYLEIRFWLQNKAARESATRTGVWGYGSILQAFTQALQQPPFEFRFDGQMKMWYKKVPALTESPLHAIFSNWNIELARHKRAREEDGAQAQEYARQRARREQEELEAQRAIAQREVREREEERQEALNALRLRQEAMLRERQRQRERAEAVERLAEQLEERVYDEGFAVLETLEGDALDLRQEVEAALRGRVQQKLKAALDRTGRLPAESRVVKTELQYPQMQAAVQALVETIVALTDKLVAFVEAEAGPDRGLQLDYVRANELSYSTLLTFPEEVGLSFKVRAATWASKVSEGAKTVRDAVAWSVRAQQPEWVGAINDSLKRDGYGEVVGGAQIQVRSMNAVYSALNGLFEAFTPAQRRNASRWTFTRPTTDPYLATARR